VADRRAERTADAVRPNGTCRGRASLIAVVVESKFDDGGDTVVRRDREKFRIEPFVLGSVDRLYGAGRAGFREEHRDLVAIGGRPIVKVDHAEALAAAFQVGCVLGVGSVDPKKN
jgi:hypothetical protein